MAEILKGAPVVAAINQNLMDRTAALVQKGITPCLAIVRIGEKDDDISYERGAAKRCETIGVQVRKETLPADCSQDRLLAVLDTLNRDAEVHGVLLLRPLPRHIDDEAVRNALLPQKDVDGITDASLAGVFTGQSKGYAPCTAQACMEILRHYQVDLTGKRAVVVGRSLVVGKPVAMMLMGQNATVTVCHTRTKKLQETCREAEVLVVSAGQAGAIGKEALSSGQIVIDVGIHVTAEGSLCGDVIFEEAQALVQGITPVPGGVGTVTTSVLVGNVVDCAERMTKAT